MKYILILFVLATLVFILYFQFKKSAKTEKIEVQQRVSKWNDSLFKHLPKGIDTNIIVQDAFGTPLKFSQYIKPVFDNDAIIYQDNGVWKLQQTTKSAYDSLSKEDYGIAKDVRAMAYRSVDTVKSWRKKLNVIAHTLAQADYILVLKSKRKMFVQRKEETILTFTINLGFNPLGKKITDGDGKTPEGIYHLDNKQEREDKFYKSFWISYPNLEDKALAKSKGLKPGVGILIHGTNAANVATKDWTAGCIALQNKDIDQLFDRVAAGTPIEIRK